MSQQETQRLEIIQRVSNKTLRQIDAVKILNLSRRQVQRLVNRYRKAGAKGLVSLHRGKPSNHRYSDGFRKRCISIIEKQYPDFGPTLASEKLSEKHQISISSETVRQWMIQKGLWIPRDKKSRKIHPPRHRRACVGELIQLDGSYHDWFEGRSAKCCLLVFVDDATSKIMHLHFCDAESTFSYMAATQQYLTRYGKPVSFYTDKHGVFRINHPSAKEKTKLSQYGRALKELNIDLICANSPQAKGRVERANKTLQDRLIKEMRLEGIDTIEQANNWTVRFIERYNARFAKLPQSEKNLHRPLRETQQELNDIFSWQTTRVVSKSLSLQYDKVLYLLEHTTKSESLIGKKVMIHDYPNGSIDVKHCGESLSYRVFDKLDKVRQGEVIENKRLDAVLALARHEQAELESQGKRQRNLSSPDRKEQIRQSIINPAVIQQIQQE